MKDTSQDDLISIIIPMLNAERTLEACLQSINSIVDKNYEVILVDDGSQDSSLEIAARYPFRLLQHLQTKGAAASRNYGASQAKGDILLFLDADIIAQKDIISRVRRRFAEDDRISAMVGSYTKHTTEKGFFSIYKNLEHHFAHHSFDKEFISFVTFAGAVKKSVFEELNGFNSDYEGATVEDVEFGYRISQAGYKIALDKDLMVVHQKRMTFLSFIKVELINRAIPWSVLLFRRKELKFNPSIGISNILSVMIFGLLGLSFILLVLPYINIPKNMVGYTMFALTASLILLNSKFYIFLSKEKPLPFVVSGILTHQLSYLLKLIGIVTGFLIFLKTTIIPRRS